MTALRAKLIVVVLIAAIAEVLLLRIALRLGPVLPAQGDVLWVFAVIERVGVVALNVGVLAGSLLIGLVAVDALRAGWGGIPLALALLGAVMVNLSLQPLVSALPAGTPAMLHGLVTGAAVLLTVMSASQTARLRVTLALVGTTQVLALAQAMSLSIGLTADTTAFSVRPLVLAEVGAVVSALALPYLLRVRPRRGEVVLGVLVGVLVTIAATVQPWGLATIGIWTMAFSLFLPPILYGAAIASVIVTILSLRREPGGAEIISGLALIVLAGLKLDVSAYAVMALTGLLVVSRAGRSSLNGAEKRVPSPSWLDVAVVAKRPIA